MALTTQAAIEQRLQWDITADPDSTITALIAAATSHMEAEVGRPLESATYTDEEHDPPLYYADPILLDHFPVTAVSAVSVDGTALTVADDVVFYEDGRLYRASDSREVTWGTLKRKAIKVTYTAGYSNAATPSQFAHLGSICAEVVARAFRSGAASAAIPAGVGLGGITQVSLDGSDSVTYGLANSATVPLGGGLSRFIHLLDDERRQLRRYKRALVA